MSNNKTRRQINRSFATIKNGTQCYIDGVLTIKIADKRVMTHDGVVVEVANNTLVRVKKL